MCLTVYEIVVSSDEFCIQYIIFISIFIKSLYKNDKFYDSHVKDGKTNRKKPLSGLKYFWHKTILLQVVTSYSLVIFTLNKANPRE